MPQHQVTDGIFGTTTNGGLYSGEYWRSFRRFGESLVELGFVKTADTGQYDWNFSGTPASSVTDNVLTNYEIYRFDDEAQATDPVFMKVSYHLYAPFANTARNPTVAIEFGTGSNGTGGLTGSAGSPIGFRVSTSNTNGAFRDWQFSGDGSGFVAILGTTADGLLRYNIMVERLKDDTGAVIPGKIGVYSYGFVMSGLATTGQTIGTSAAVVDLSAASISGRYGLMMSRPSSSVDISDTWAYMIPNKYPFAAAGLMLPDGSMGHFKLAVGYSSGDLPPGLIVTVPTFSEDDQIPYRVIKPSRTFQSPFTTSNPTGTIDNGSGYILPALYWGD